MGVILFIAKFVISMVYVEFLSGTNTPIYCLETYRAFKKTCQHYRISKNISIGESKYIKTPMILGLFKPIILFPIGVINQLDMSETEAILAHELAHFVRKDIYINVIQTFMEALLYYHPAIWWISSNIRLERESCCDDLAIGYLGDNVHYAKTLVKPHLSLTFQ
jgi:beta-lactamase regulating signal transducer with metallopeptidase domain